MSIRKKLQSRPVISAMFLAGLAALLLLTLQYTKLQTQDQIQLSQQGYLQSVRKSVLTGIAYDRIVLLELNSQSNLPNQQVHISQISQLFKQQKGVAWLVLASTTAGYNGTIQLLISLRPDLSVHAVRVIQHQETPGLGDKIDRQRSLWIDSFEGRSLKNTPQIAWQLRDEGGEFDQFSGASITPRAVVQAVHVVLQGLGQGLEFELSGAS